MTWLRKGWPWLVAVFWLVGYELVSLVTSLPTLSSIATGAGESWAPLPWLAAAGLAVLLIHFWWWDSWRGRQ